MTTAKLSDRLKELVLELSSNPDELHRYGKNPAAYLRKRGFSKKVIDAVTFGGQALQPLLASAGKAALPVYLVIGVKGFRPAAAGKKATAKAKVKKATKKKA